MPSHPDPTPIYHFTHIDNLSDLLDTGALLCKNEMLRRGGTCRSVAYETIQQQRQNHPVPVPPGGKIHDYVPFYFNSLSPMLYTIKCGNVEGVNPEQLVFIKSTAQLFEASGNDFVFTDGHGIMALSDYYNDLVDLDKVPWEVINTRYWNNYPDGKRLRQSEFLAHNKFKWELVELLGVYNTDMKTRVKDMIADLSHRPKVKIKSNWYF